MESTGLIEVLCATLAAFAGFEVALAVNYLLLKLLLRAMHLGLRQGGHGERYGGPPLQDAASARSRSL